MQRACLGVLVAVVLALLATFFLMVPPQIVEQKPMANDFSSDSTCKALWRFESGALLTDSKGGNTLTEYNAAISAATGAGYYKEGSASIVVEGSDSYRYPYINDSALDSGFPFKDGDTNLTFSLAGWFRFDQDWPGSLFLKGSTFVSQNRTISFACVYNWPDIELELRVYGTSTNQTIQTSGAGLAEDQWYHVGLAIDGPNKTYLIRLYDATADSVQTFSGSFTPDLHTGDFPIHIGRDMDGYLDEYVIFDDVKTADDFDDIRSGTYSVAAPIETADTTWAWKSIAPLARAIDNPPQWVWKMIPPASKWSLPRATPRRDIFICILRKTGLADYEVPMASMQLRRRDGLPTLVSCVVPDYLTHYAAAEARKDGEIIIMAGSVTADGTRHISELERATFEHATYDHGANSSSISLSGYRTTAITNPRPVDLTGLTYYGLQADGKRRVRGKINQFLRPGDTAIYSGGSFVVDQIYISVEATNAWMEAAGL
jgi:hypothetical protein